MESKHAYLIQAHNNFNQLKKLLELLDDDRNDIYLHIDKKSDVSEALKEDLTNSLKHSPLTFVERIEVNWGGYSQIASELILLEEAIKTPHSYYHLISGADLPIKSQDEIHSFFKENEGNEFISIQYDFPEKEINNRIAQYHYLQDFTGRKTKLIHKVLRRVEVVSVKLQKLVGVNRLKNYPKVYKGANWFSITHNLAEYIVSKEAEIEKVYSKGDCADELFVQTIAMNSEFKDRIKNDYRRYIDWNRGLPYTFRLEDYDEIMISDCFWARKFSESVDSQIIDAIYNHLKLN